MTRAEGMRVLLSTLNAITEAGVEVAAVDIDGCCYLKVSDEEGDTYADLFYVYETEEVVWRAIPELHEDGPL